MTGHSTAYHTTYHHVFRLTLGDTMVSRHRPQSQDTLVETNTQESPHQSVLQQRLSSETIPSDNCQWYKRSETIGRFLIVSSIKKSLWQYAMTMLNIWLPKGNKIPLSEVNIANIETEF